MADKLIELEYENRGVLFRVVLIPVAASRWESWVNFPNVPGYVSCRQVGIYSLKADANDAAVKMAREIIESQIAAADLGE